MLPLLRSMSRRPSAIRVASERLQAVQRAMASTSTSSSNDKSEPIKHGVTPKSFEAAENVPVLFESDQSTRTYVLNREKALNALNEPMIDLLMPKLQVWEESPECKIIIGTGKGRAFCAGGDVRAVTRDATVESTRHKASMYFKKEFELDYALAVLRKPYVAIMDGITMGGGLGLSVHAPFRVATEKSQIAMPETKIGYAPDVGATFFLPKLDGMVGTYLALTGNTVVGKGVFQLGIATHYVASASIPKLLERLAALDTENFDIVNSAIEEFSAVDTASEPGTDLVGEKRKAVDAVFGKNTVEEIIKGLEGVKEKGGELGEWAEQVLGDLALRSPTALKVALEAQRLGANITLPEALQVEMRFATAFCSGASPDFLTGVKAVLEDRLKGRPDWQPPTLEEIPRETVVANFFSAKSPYTQETPKLEFSAGASRQPMQYALPSEEMIGRFVRGEHIASGTTAVTANDVIMAFGTAVEGKFVQKAGVKEKVLEVISRKCKVKKSGEDEFLQWIH